MQDSARPCPLSRTYAARSVAVSQTGASSYNPVMASLLYAELYAEGGGGARRPPQRRPTHPRRVGSRGRPCPPPRERHRRGTQEGGPRSASDRRRTGAPTAARQDRANPNPARCPGCGERSGRRAEAPGTPIRAEDRDMTRKPPGRAGKMPKGRGNSRHVVTHTPPHTLSRAKSAPFECDGWKLTRGNRGNRTGPIA